MGSQEQEPGDEALSMLTLATLSHSRRPARPALSVSVTSRRVMFAHGVLAEHLNCATFVFLETS